MKRAGCLCPPFLQLKAGLSNQESQGRLQDFFLSDEDQTLDAVQTGADHSKVSAPLVEMRVDRQRETT
jgi:hypothetical protein